MTRDIGFTPERATKTGPVSPADSVTSRSPGEGAARADGPVRRSVAGVWTVRALAVRVYAVLVWRWPGGVRSRDGKLYLRPFRKRSAVGGAIGQRAGAAAGNACHA